MYPRVLVIGTRERDVERHYAEIVDGIADIDIPVVSCRVCSPFPLPIRNLSDDEWHLCNIVRTVESAMLAYKGYYGESVVVVYVPIPSIESEDMRRAYMNVLQYLVDASDIIFTVGKCVVDGTDIEHATGTATEIVEMVVRDGV